MKTAKPTDKDWDDLKDALRKQVTREVKKDRIQTEPLHKLTQKEVLEAIRRGRKF